MEFPPLAAAAGRARLAFSSQVDLRRRRLRKQGGRVQYPLHELLERLCHPAAVLRRALQKQAAVRPRQRHLCVRKKTTPSAVSRAAEPVRAGPRYNPCTYSASDPLLCRAREMVLFSSTEGGTHPLGARDSALGVAVNLVANDHPNSVLHGRVHVHLPQPDLRQVLERLPPRHVVRCTASPDPPRRSRSAQPLVPMDWSAWSAVLPWRWLGMLPHTAGGAAYLRADGGTHRE